MERSVFSMAERHFPFGTQKTNIFNANESVDVPWEMNILCGYPKGVFYLVVA